MMFSQPQPNLPMGPQQGGQQGLFSLLQMLGPFLLPLLRSYLQQQQGGMGGMIPPASVGGANQAPGWGAGRLPDAMPLGPMPPPPYQGPPGPQTMTPGPSRPAPTMGPQMGGPFGAEVQAGYQGGLGAPGQLFQTGPQPLNNISMIQPGAPLQLPTQTLSFNGPEVIGQGFNGAAGLPGQSY